jgi:hypothetical protein
MTRRILAVLALIAIFSLAITYAEAEDDDDEERFGLGEQEREEEDEDEDDEGGIASPYSNLILYVTAGAIAAAFAYTGFRIYQSKSHGKK